MYGYEVIEILVPYRHVWLLSSVWICWHGYDVIPQAVHHKCANISSVALAPMQKLIHRAMNQVLKCSIRL